MSKTKVRVPAIPADRLSAEQLSLVGGWTKMNFSTVVVNHPAIYRTFVPYLAQLITNSKLPPREREVVCLRSLELCGDVYEQHHHKTIAGNVGMTGQEIEDACRGEGDTLSAFEKLVARATEELVKDQFLSDATWKALQEQYSQTQIMDLVFLTGCYVTMAMVTKSFGIELESPEVQEELNANRKYV